MRSVTIIILLMAMLFITSCDRYKHKFVPVDFNAKLFNPLQTTFDAMNINNLTTVMSYFADDYLHNGVVKADRLNWFQSLLVQNEAITFDVNLIDNETLWKTDTDTLITVQWRLRVYDSSNSLVADSTFVNDRIVCRNSKWIILGNGRGTNFQTTFFNPLQTSFETITPNSLAPVMNVFASDYMHNGQSKIEREIWLQEIFAQDTNPTFEVTRLNSVEVYDTLAVTDWRLVVKNSAQEVIADSTFQNDRLVKRSGVWYLTGNREISTQRVFVETFTYTTCPNCPVVEALLHEQQLANPDFTYLEYHINDEVTPLPGNMDIYQYYGYPSFPVVFFQGETKISGNNADNEANFNQLTQTISAIQSKVKIVNAHSSISGGEIHASMRVVIIDQNVTQDNLKLKYALIDKESDEFNNNAGAPCRNVVLTKGEMSIATTDLTQPIIINQSYTDVIPEDAYLVIWTQKIPTPFVNNATVYNAVEIPISAARVFK